MLASLRSSLGHPSLTHHFTLMSVSTTWVDFYSPQQYNRQVVLCWALGLDWQRQDSTWDGYPKSSLVTWMVIEGTFSKFLSNAQVLGAADMLEGRTDMWKVLKNLEKLADVIPRGRKHQSCIRDSKPTRRNSGSGWLIAALQKWIWVSWWTRSWTGVISEPSWQRTPSTYLDVLARVA